MMRAEMRQTKTFEQRMMPLQEFSAGQREDLLNLNLSCCEAIEQLPSWVGQLTGLRHLDLSRCSCLKELPLEIGQLTGLQHLDLSRCSCLKELPLEIWQLTGLQHLDLSMCSCLKELPSGIGQLTGLQHLNLAYCRLHEVPPRIGQLTRLQHLNLACSDLDVLPSWIGLLMWLQHLDLSRCMWLYELPSGIGQLTRLQHLNLFQCECLYELPSWMRLLTRLQHLNLARCLSMEELPAWIGQLTRLQHLNLSNCPRVKELPSGMGQLTGLQHLDLSWCQSLEELPSWMGLLTELEHLNLSGHSLMKLRELPICLGQLLGLQHLNLAGCKSLFELPSWIGQSSEMGQLTELQQLDLSGCKLRELPSWIGQLTGLDHLNLAGCKLRELPLWMGKLSRLQHLNLAGCKLRELPSWMGQLVGLRHLNLAKCQSLKELPSWMGQLTRLQYLDLSWCYRVTELPSGMWKLTGLQHLNLPGCALLAELPSEMGQLTGLQHLDLSGYPSLAELPSWMGQLTGLQHLDLSGCSSLKELPSWMGKLTNLSDLHLPKSLHTPSRDVREQGLQHILQYLRDLSIGSAPCHLVKLVLVGDYGAGKSSLGDSLRAGEPHPRAEADRTVGIDVCRWMPDSKSQVIVHMYDTAGHKVYQASHRVFMSLDSLYMVVVRCDQAAERAASSVLKWVDIVESVSPGCVMVVVGSCIDLCTEDIDLYMGRVMECVERARREAGLEVATELKMREGILEDKLRPMDETKWWEFREERDIQLQKLEEGLVVMYEPLAPFREAPTGPGPHLDFLYATGDSDSDSYAPAPTLEPPRASGNSIISRVEQLHEDMMSLECAALKASHGELLSRVRELRHLRARRLRVIFCRAVSNSTGEGLGQLKRSLLGILGSRELFPHLGMKRPLSYSLLERCMRRVPATPCDMPMADWERACEKHHMQKAAECGEALQRLQEVCKGDVVKLSTLREAAGACGIGGGELASALKFLHASGSLLFFGGEGDGADGGVLQEHVFSRPGWVIDAVKCFIHEWQPQDLNDEYRAMLARVEARYEGELQRYRQTGRLSDRLLRGLWASYDEAQRWTEAGAGGAGFERHQRVLVALMCSLRLMRRVGVAEKSGEQSAMIGAWEEDHTAYVVPAMFPAEALPTALVEPRWLPEEAQRAEAWMRRQYQGLGQVPYGFLSELQVEWSCGSDDVNHYGAENDALASSLGSHLFAAYGQEGVEVEEHVVVSLWQEAKESGDGVALVRSKLCVMGWTRVRRDTGSIRGTATWELFRHVTGCIERRLRQRPCGLGLTDATVPWVGGGEGRVEEVQASICRRSKDLKKKQVWVAGRWVALNELWPLPRTISAKRGRPGEGDEASPEDGIGRAEKRPRELGSSNTDCQARMSEAGRSHLDVKEVVKAPGILAFFAQQSGDRINIQRESQELTRRVRMRRSMDFIPNNQPSFEEFRDALMCASRDHVRVLHLAGHCNGKAGFYFLRDNTGSTYEAIPTAIVAPLIAQTSVDAGGTVECVVLNACKTEAMGRALREAGVWHVVCWRWEVATGAAMAFAEAFYNQLLFLVEEGGAAALTSEAYRKAFSQGKLQFQVWEGRPKQQESERMVSSVGWSGENGLLWLSRDGNDDSCAAQRR